MISRRTILPLAIAIPLAACRDDNSPYIEFAGGGFVFNYRIADHYYGFVAQVKKPLPQGGKLEAQFEVPSGGLETVTADVREGQLQYMFRSSNLRGIVKDHPYQVALVVRDRAGAQLARYERRFQSDIDDSSLPDAPLVVGPGYQKAPGG